MKYNNKKNNKNNRKNSTENRDYRAYFEIGHQGHENLKFEN